MKLVPIAFLIVLMMSFSVDASLFNKDIVMAINQSEYYFPVGSDAIIYIGIDNGLNKDVSAVLGYTISQQINQAGFMYSSSNTQSQSITILKDQNNMTLDLGTSDKPMDMTLSLKLSYEDKTSILDDIKIHFVSPQNNQQNQQNDQESKQKSQTNKGKKSTTTKNGAQNTAQNTAQNLHQKSSQSTKQQRLQNSQLSQDTNALKDEIRKEVENKKQMQQEFAKELSKNPDFNKAHSDMLKQGHNLTSANINPITNKTGDFELNYGNKTLKGHMQNGSVSFEKEHKNMLDELKKDDRFKELNQRLLDEGFSEQNTYQGNDIEIKYADVNNNTKSIIAKIDNETIKKVYIKEEFHMPFIWPFLFVVLVIGFVLFVLFGKQKPEQIIAVKSDFDYKKEALKHIKKAKKTKDAKEAFGLISYGVRLYYSYRFGLKKQITTGELIKFLKEKNIAHSDVASLLEKCDMVEYAKFSTNAISSAVDDAIKLIK